jgi:hypothetical protein
MEKASVSPTKARAGMEEWIGDVLLVVLCRDSALIRSSDVELAVWRVQRAYK